LDSDRVAQVAGYKNTVNGAFAALRASAIEFGLIKSSGGYISVSEPWIEAFNSDDLDQLKRVRQSATLQPRLYRQLFDVYKDRQLPSAEKLSRDLHLNQKYNVLKDAASSAAQVFLESVKYAELVDSKNFLKAPSTQPV